MGVMLSAAGSLRWYRDALAPDVGFADLVTEAGTAPPGSDGLLFLPYLTGERTPHPDPSARGAFVGLTVRHTRAHLTRAVLEGVTFGLRDSLELIRSLDPSAPGDRGDGQPLRLTGGGSASMLWRRILADVAGAPVATTSTTEGAAQGAAMLAAVGVGWFPSVPDACGALVGVDEMVEPSTDGSAASVYADRYEHYRALYPALWPTFHALDSGPDP